MYVLYDRVSSLVQKAHSKMYSPLCVNTHPEVVDLEVHEVVRNFKNGISQEWNMTFWEMKDFLICASGGYTLRRYRSVAEVTFK